MKKREITIPTLVGLFVVIGGLISGLWLVQRQLSRTSRAATDERPRNVVVANTTDTSFTVSWVTEKAVSGFVQYGEGGSNPDLVVSDDRDQQKGSVENYFTHFVTIRGLKPDTTYKFQVGSGGEKFDQDGVPYEIRTGVGLVDPPAADVAYGQVVTQSGEPADGSVVYLQLPGGNVQTSLVKPSGSWVIPLSTVRNNNLSDFVVYDRITTQIEVSVEAGPMGTSRIVTTTGNDSPVPEIVLGDNKSYVGEGNVETGGEGAKEESKFGSFDEPQIAEKDLELTSPVSGEGINSSRPEIIGTAPAGAEIAIEIHSEAIISGTAVADSQGRFAFSVPADLPPGEHTVTISTIVDGVVQRVTRTFTVYAADESFDPAFSATPSATLSPSISPTRTVTPSITPIATTTPTRTPTPTKTPTPKPTVSATPTVNPSISPTPKPAGGDTSLPASGATEATLGLLLLGSGLMTTGWWWYQKRA